MLVFSVEPCRAPVDGFCEHLQSQVAGSGVPALCKL